MKIVVDTNIVFSALLNKESNIGDIILNSQDVFTFYSCEYLREEIANYREKIIRLANYSEKEYAEIEFLVYRHLHFFSESTIPFEFWGKAAELVRETDMDDIAFIALTLFLDVKFWTGDKALIDGLTGKAFQNIITTQEMLSIRREIIK